MRESRIFSYQTRLLPSPEEEATLSAYADLYGRAERSLLARLCAGEDAGELKASFSKRFGFTSRQFNSIYAELKGKIDTIRKRRPGLIAEAKTRVTRAERVIAKLEKRAPGSAKLHQKKRRLFNLKTRLANLVADHAAGTVRLCLGSKKRFRAQFDLQANGHASHDEWRKAWQAARGNHFYVLGSQDETAGCQGCVASVQDDGSLSLRLRLPDALKARGKHIEIPGICFAYGQAEVLAALASSRRVDAFTKSGKRVRKLIGVALSYRFLRDKKGWRVFVSVEAPETPRVSRRVLGAIGVDVNADHLAAAELDRFGNLVQSRRVGCVTYGKSRAQTRAVIGDAVKRIAQQARKAGKPVTVEKLDFTRKKAELESADPKAARMISSFACRKTLAMLKAACFRAAVEVIEVNPAHTSVIGAVNHARRHGISVHQGAAIAVARRGLGLSESPAVRKGVVPTRNGDHVTFALPVRNRAKHVWSQWSRIRTVLRAAHVAHVRSGAGKHPPAPLRQSKPALGAIWTLPVKSRHANRHQHCSDGVSDDVPQ